MDASLLSRKNVNNVLDDLIPKCVLDSLGTYRRQSEILKYWNPLLHNGEESGKVIRRPHLDWITIKS